MSVIRVNNITNRSGGAGPTIAGVGIVSSTSYMVVPTGRTGQRYADEGENIVRDGLVLYLDAKHSYPSKTGIGTTTSGASATAGSSIDGEPYTWYDMSGYENNGQLVNNVGYNASNGGSLVFDGVNDYVDLGKKISGFDGYPIDTTVDVWIKFNSYPSNFGLFIGKYSGGVSNGWELFYYSDGKLEVAGREDDSQYLMSGKTTTSYPIGAIYNIVYTKKSNVWSLYVNKTLSVSTVLGKGNIPIYTDISTLQLGWVEATTYATNCSIYSTKIYNRALTDAEVSQNFNALRSRFGI